MHRVQWRDVIREKDGISIIADGKTEIPHRMYHEDGLSLDSRRMERKGEGRNAKEKSKKGGRGEWARAERDSRISFKRLPFDLWSYTSRWISIFSRSVFFSVTDVRTSLIGAAEINARRERRGWIVTIGCVHASLHSRKSFAWEAKFETRYRNLTISHMIFCTNRLTQLRGTAMRNRLASCSSTFDCSCRVFAWRADRRRRA